MRKQSGDANCSSSGQPGEGPGIDTKDRYGRVLEKRGTGVFPEAAVQVFSR